MLMIRLRYLNQTSLRALNNHNYTVIKYLTKVASNAVVLNPLLSSYPSPVKKLPEDNVILSFQFHQWFKSNQNQFLERIIQILTCDKSTGVDVDLALSQLNLRLTESLVLDVLSYGKDVLTCLKFFDWAGRQPGFHHSRATFNAIFKILSRSKQMSLILEYLEDFAKDRGGPHRTNFHSILVMGYAVAGKPEIALQLFGRMRYQGIDLDDFAYHVLLNALVEENYFDGVESVSKQIKSRGFESEVTHSILVKCFCRKKEFEQADTYLRGVMSSGTKLKSGAYIVGALVDGLCKNEQFDKAGKLVDEFGEFHVYDVWIRELVRARKIDGALDFLTKMRNKELVVHYVPDVFRYNSLILRLLRENRLEEACDLIIEMKENNIPPDELTMNIVLCFFCKAGMVDVAVRLYDSRGEFGLSLNSMAFNYLMNTLCGEEESVVDAYRILKNSIDQGYFPGKTTFFILADALCKLEKLDMMNDLYRVALENNIVLSDKIHENFINALCRNGRVEDSYLLHGELNRLNKVTSRCAYNSMINGFINSKRVDIAVRLVIEMQEKRHTPNRWLFRSTIRNLCSMENPENQLQKLLEMQLSLDQKPDCSIFNIFIEGAGLAKKPDLAREVYQIMKRSGISPNVSSDILLLKSYLHGAKTSDALDFFRDILVRRKIGRKILNTIVIGFCKANKPDIALEIFLEIREIEKTIRPSLECYEELIYSLCKHRQYDKILHLIEDMLVIRRPISSYIGNNLLLISLKDRRLYETWSNMRLFNKSSEEPSPIQRLSELVGLFSDRVKDKLDSDDLEQVIKTCFRVDIFTYNMILRKLSMKQPDDASELFEKIRRNGYEPNQWTYETLVHGFYKNGRKTDAKAWVKEMLRRGYDPSEATKVLL